MQYLDGLMQERCDSSASAMELHLSCIKPWIWVLSHMPLFWFEACADKKCEMHKINVKQKK